MKTKTFEKSDLDMLISCFTYGYLGWSTYYLDIVAKYGQEATDLEVQKLSEKYEVESSVYTDDEGCSYNSLKEK